MDKNLCPLAHGLSKNLQRSYREMGENFYEIRRIEGDGRHSRVYGVKVTPCYFHVCQVNTFTAEWKHLGKKMFRNYTMAEQVISAIKEIIVTADKVFER